jgi:hypothetical protein
MLGSIEPARGVEDDSGVHPVGGVVGAEVQHARHETPVAVAAEELAFAPADTAPEAGLRIEFAQASTTGQTDAVPAVSVAATPPWALVAGGLLAGGLLAALGGSNGIRIIQRTWSPAEMSVDAPINTRTIIDASKLADPPPLPRLTLSGPGIVEITGLKTSSDIRADALLTGTLQLQISDDDSADLIRLYTGSGDTTVQSVDAFDNLYIDAARLPAVGKLTVSGELASLIVVNMTGVLDYSGLTRGTVEVHTGEREAGVPALASLAGPVDRVVTLVAGDVSSTVDSDDSDERVVIAAGEISDGRQLTTTGDGEFLVTDFSANLINHAAGGIEVTLGNADMFGLVSITSSTAVTAHNGRMRDTDDINVSGAGSFSIDGLKADLNASGSTGSVSVKVADAGDNVISLSTGQGNFSVADTVAGDLIAVEAALLAADKTLTVVGAGGVNVSRFSATLDASGLTGHVLVATTEQNLAQSIADQSISVKAAQGDTNVRLYKAGDVASVDASALATAKQLAIEGQGIFSVQQLSSTLVNAARQATATLASRDASGTFAVSISSNAAITIQNGSFDADDRLVLLGNETGQFTVNGLVADLDASATLGEIKVTTAASASTNQISMTTGQGDVWLKTTGALDTVHVDARLLDADGGRLDLYGQSAVHLTLGATTPQDAGFVIRSETDNVAALSATNFTVHAAAGLTAADRIKVDLTGVQAGVTVSLDAPTDFTITGVQADLAGAGLAVGADVDVALYDADAAAIYAGTIETGAGNDRIRFYHQQGNSFTALTPQAGSLFDLGSGANELHVGKGLSTGAAFDLSDARLRVSSNAGTGLVLVMSDSTSAIVSSAHLQAISVGGFTGSVLTDIREALDSPLNQNINLAQQTPFGAETVHVDTTAGALGGLARSSFFYLLDESIESWSVGVVAGGGDNNLALGNNLQTVRLGSGSDSVWLNGMVAGNLVGVERLYVDGVGSIAAAGVTDDESVLQPNTGSLSPTVIVDFRNSDASLTMTTRQHESVNRLGNFVNVGTGDQNIEFYNATLDQQAQADTALSSIPLLNGIESYALSSNRIAGPGSALRILDSVGGQNYAVDASTATVLTALNDVSQAPSTSLIEGSGGNDVIRTSAIDAERGRLTIDLRDGGQDVVFVGNVWGNGSSAVRVLGFDTLGASIDRLAMITDQGVESSPGFVSVSSSQVGAPRTLGPQVLEFETGYANSIVQPASATDLAKIGDLLRLSFGSSAGGRFYALVYGGEANSEDAWLYSVFAGPNGFDYVGGASQSQSSTLELIAIFEDVGANAFSAANFAHFLPFVQNINPPLLLV